MNIVWAENPLKTVVELDEADKLLLRERIKVSELQERIVSAYFAIDPEHQAQLAKNGRGRSPEEGLAEARKALDLDYLLDETEQYGKTFQRVIDDRLAWCVSDLAGEHCGDCTCVPSSCLKCEAEALLEIDTTKGLGKHEASKIGGAFKDGASIEEAIRRLENYVPTWNETWRDRAAFDLHVPRWTEEGRRAHEWLVSYKRERIDPYCLRSPHAKDQG